MTSSTKTIVSDSAQTGFAESANRPLIGQPVGSQLDADLRIGDVFRYIWNAKRYIMAGVFLLLGLAAALILFKNIIAPSVTSYRSSISMTMASEKAGTYPNGAPFAPSDLRSPAVLEAVFDANKLGDYGLDLAAFADMVAVESYSPVYESTVKRYRDRLDSKTITFEERRSVEEEFSAALAAVSGQGLLVTLSLPDNSSIGQPLALKIVNDIPAKWADVFINRLGAANLPVEVSGTELIDEKLVADLDYPLVFDYLNRQYAKLDDRLKSIEAIPGATTIISKSDGKSISDLRRELESIGEFRLNLGMRPFVDLGLSRDKEITETIYKNLTRSLALEVEAGNDKSLGISNVLNEFRSNGVTVAPGGGAVSVGPFPSQSAVTQIDGSMVDKIIELAKNGEGLDFQKELLEKKLQIETSNAVISDQSRRLILRLESLKPTSTDIVNKARLISEFEGRAAETKLSLNNLWSESNRFLDEINLKRLNFDKKLYKGANLADDMRIETPPVVSLRTLIILAASSIIGALAGLMLYLARNVLSARR